MIDYIFTDRSLECLKTVIFETPIKSKHLATVLICNENIKEKTQFILKKIFSKEHYDKDVFRAKLRELNWNLLYTMQSPDEMMFLFHSMLSKIINQCAPPKTVFIRKNKLYVKLKSDAITEKMFASTTSEHEKWKIINDIRNSTKSNIQRLKNSFGETVTNNKRMADLMNYRFSRLGDYFGKNQPQKYCKKNDNNNFNFRFITSQECRTQIMNLSVHKPLGPSSIPAWALRDGCSELVEPLTMIFNSFISQSSFPTLFKKTIVTPGL